MRENYKPQIYWDLKAEEFEKYSGSWQLKGVIGAEKLFFQYWLPIAEKLFFEKIPIKKNMHILDIGCGIGRWSFEFAKRGAVVTGIDFSEKMIKTAKELAIQKGVHNISFQVMNAMDLNFPDNFFDLVTSITVLQHIVNEEQFRLAVKEIVRVTKLKGNIVILETAIPVLLSKLSFPKIINKIKGIEDTAYRTMEDYSKAFELAGVKMLGWSGVNVAWPFLYAILYLLKFGKTWSDFFYLSDKSISLPNSFIPCLKTLNSFLSSASLGKYGWDKIMIFKKVG